MSESKPTCASCGGSGLLVALHGDRGGPDVCIECSGKWLATANQKARREFKRLNLFMRMLGDDAGDPEALADLLRADVLAAAIRLTHPDRHPPDRAETARRVTAALTAAREHALASKPPPEPAQPRDGSDSVARLSGQKAVTAPVDDQYPCATCRHLPVALYCDRCRKRWEADDETRRERERTYRRDLRARWRVEHEPRECDHCHREFTPVRSDSRYCSAVCRQRAYRERRRAARPG